LGAIKYSWRGKVSGCFFALAMMITYLSVKGPHPHYSSGPALIGVMLPEVTALGVPLLLSALFYWLEVAYQRREANKK
jgi:hypothetical protein